MKDKMNWFLLSLYAAGVAFQLAWVGFFIWVAVHFVRKYW